MFSAIPHGSIVCSRKAMVMTASLNRGEDIFRDTKKMLVVDYDHDYHLLDVVEYNPELCVCAWKENGKEKEEIIHQDDLVILSKPRKRARYD